MRRNSLRARLNRGNNRLGELPTFVRAKAGATTLLGAATATRADASTCAMQADANGVWATALANVLRDSHYVAGIRTILLESSRVNLHIRNQALDNAAWTATRSTVTADQTAGFDGATNAEKIIEDNTATNSHLVLSTANIAVANGSRYTITIFAKKGARIWVNFQEGQGVTANAFFNLDTGVLGGAGAAGTGAPTASIEGPFTNGLYRLRVSFTTVGIVARIRVVMASADGTTVYSGDAASEVYATGAQMELGDFPTSPIITGAAAVTRAVDALSYAGVAFSGTLFYRYWDLATLTWLEAVAAYTANDPIVPAVDRAYSDIIVVQGPGTRTAADIHRIVGSLG